MLLWTIFATWLMSVPCLLPEVECQTGATAKALRQKLFITDGYDYRIRPVQDQSGKVFVRVEFYLLALNGVDEASETVQTTGYLNVIWTDEFLVWNTSDYENIESTQYPQSEVWTPDIALKNSYLDYKQLGVSSLNVRVKNNGLVVWQPFQVFQSTCAIDITYFPFDEQTCSLSFVAWSYRKAEVFVHGGAEGIVMRNFQQSSQWDIPETTWYNTEDDITSSITFEMKLKRKPLYNVLTIVFPVILLAFLNLLVFTIPCASGEKSGYAITVFLAFAVFLTIIESTFPKNSETVSYFAIYVIVQTAQSTLITFIALFMIKCSHFDEGRKVPKVVISLARLGKCKCGLKCRTPRADNEVSVMTVKETDKRVCNINEHEKAKAAAVDEEAKEEYTWNWAMNGLDNLFLIFFSCLLASVTFGCILAAYMGGT